MISVLAVNEDETKPTVIWPITVLRGNNEAPSKKLVEDVLGLTDIECLQAFAIQ